MMAYYLRMFTLVFFLLVSSTHHISAGIVRRKDSKSTVETFNNDNVNDNSNEDSSHPRRGWLLWVQLSCLTLAALGILAKLYTKCKGCCSKCCHDGFGRRRSDLSDVLSTEFTVCYLCNKKVPSAEWVTGETGHRSYCAVKSKQHRDVLSEMPRTSLPCDKCGELLRIWPSNMGPVFFRCREESCWSNGSLIQNNGTNRFNCFTCDLDTCRECGNAEMADTKDIKDDPLVLAAKIFQHRASVQYVPQHRQSTVSWSTLADAVARKKSILQASRRRSSTNIEVSMSTASVTDPVAEVCPSAIFVLAHRPSVDGLGLC